MAADAAKGNNHSQRQAKANSQRGGVIGCAHLVAKAPQAEGLDVQHEPVAVLAL